MREHATYNNTQRSCSRCLDIDTLDTRNNFRSLPRVVEFVRMLPEGVALSGIS